MYFYYAQSKASRDYLEELKCLFLRVRSPPKHALEGLIRQIIKCDLNSAEGLEWLRIGNRQFGDFRNKFLNGIERSVNSFKEKRNELLFFFFLISAFNRQKSFILMIFDRNIYYNNIYVLMFC